MTKGVRASVRIAVTPILQQGSETACEIDALSGSSSNVKGGVVKLKKGGSFTLSFEIQQDPDGPTMYFPMPPSPIQAFSCSASSCPASNGPSSGGFLSNPQVLSNKILTVDADPPNGKGLMFYRLNFSDGTSYDPIVIHD